MMAALQCTRAVLPMCKTGAIYPAAQYAERDNDVLLMRNSVVAVDQTITFVLRSHKPWRACQGGRHGVCAGIQASAGPRTNKKHVPNKSMS